MEQRKLEWKVSASYFSVLLEKLSAKDHQIIDFDSLNKSLMYQIELFGVPLIAISLFIVDIWPNDSPSNVT